MYEGSLWLVMSCINRKLEKFYLLVLDMLMCQGRLTTLRLRLFGVRPFHGRCMTERIMFCAELNFAYMIAKHIEVI